MKKMKWCVVILLGIVAACCKQIDKGQEQKKVNDSDTPLHYRELK